MRADRDAGRRTSRLQHGINRGEALLQRRRAQDEPGQHSVRVEFLAGGVSRSPRGQKFSRRFHSGVKSGARTAAETVQVDAFTVTMQGKGDFAVLSQ